MNTITDLEKCTREYRFPSGLIKLTYSKHAKSRLVERTTGELILAPSYIRLTKDNTTDVKANDRGRVISATVFIDYKRDVKMYLAISVNSGVVKTVYFKNAKKKWKTSQPEQHITIQSPTSQEIPLNLPRAEGEQGRVGEDVENVPRDLGRTKTSRRKTLLGTFWRLCRLGATFYFL